MRLTPILFVAAILLGATVAAGQQYVFANCPMPCDDAHIPSDGGKGSSDTGTSGGGTDTGGQSDTTTTPTSHFGGKDVHHSSHKHNNKHTDKSAIPSIPRIQFTQLPSNRSDYTGGDASAIRLINVHTTVDSLGFWHIQGMIQNTGNKTIQELTIRATVYNTALQPIDSGDVTVSAGGSIIFAPGEAKPFDILGSSAGVAGQGFFKLAYDFQYS